VAGDVLGGVLKLEGEERDEAGLKREDEEGRSLELTRRGDHGGFGFDSGGANGAPIGQSGLEVIGVRYEPLEEENVRGGARGRHLEIRRGEAPPPRWPVKVSDLR
jgi:hypothetical protein